jgi:hypothetical protein
MADPKTDEQTVEVADTNLEPRAFALDDPVPTLNDPGGAHAKGYSADPRPEKEVKAEGAVPLAAVAEGETHVRQPERAGKVHPTGRSEPHEYNPNDRILGSGG